MFPYVRGCDISENISLEDVKEEEIKAKCIQIEGLQNYEFTP